VAQALLPKLIDELNNLCNYGERSVLLRLRALQIREICGTSFAGIDWYMTQGIINNKTDAGCQFLVQAGFAELVGMTFAPSVIQILQYGANPLLQIYLDITALGQTSLQSHLPVQFNQPSAS
jgi:hypothetical protein